MNIVFGIDLGVKGAIAAVNPHGSCRVVDLPMEDGRLQARELLAIIRALVEPGFVGALAVIEDVQARPETNGGRRRNTLHSQGSLMRTRGACEGVLDIAGCEIRAVQPQAWKRKFGLLRSQLGGKPTDTQLKHASLGVARRLYPGAPLPLARHHNRAEAVLLAHYGLLAETRT